MKKGKKNVVIVLLVLLLAVTIGFAGYTYAKYVSTLNKNSEATVAKWAFTDDNDDGTISFDLAHTYTAGTLTDGRIAPGTSGQMDIALSNEHSEVGVSYDVSLGTLTGVPSNVKFYTDANHSTELTGSLTGTLAPGATTTVTIYWDWPYATAGGDSADTTAGEAAVTSATMTVPVVITGTQVQPVVSQ